MGRRSELGSLLIDLAGDAPTVLGIPEPDGPGMVDWLAAGDAVTVEALGRLERPVADQVRLIHRGRRVSPRPERADVLAAQLLIDERDVVIDLGSFGGDEPIDLVRRSLATQAATSLLVTKACFLSLRRALALPVRPSGIVLVEEPGRALGRTDIEDVLGVPVVATVAIDPAIARCVDAGLLAARLPADLGRALAHVG